MADFKRMGIPEVWCGASTDTKPTSAAVGSLAFETDTNAWYVCRDGTNWSAYKGDTTWLLS